MRVGHELLELARAGGARSLFVVGTGKNVGKTVAMRAVYEAACDAGLSVALTSIGRDGEAIDVGDAQPKPRLLLQPGTIVATARGVLPRSPASRLLGLSDLQTASGPLLYAQVAHAGFYELVGPPTASGIREAVEALAQWAEFIIIDGAIDRVAALAGGRDAVIVASGAAAGGDVERSRRRRRRARPAVVRSGVRRRRSVAAYRGRVNGIPNGGADRRARAAADRRTRPNADCARWEGRVARVRTPYDPLRASASRRCRDDCFDRS